MPRQGHWPQLHQVFAQLQLPGKRCDDGVENAGKSVETYGKILFFNSSICLFDVFFPIAVAYIYSYNLRVLWQFSSWVFEATSSPSLFVDLAPKHFFVDSWYVSTCITEDSSIWLSDYPFNVGTEMAQKTVHVPYLALPDHGVCLPAELFWPTCLDWLVSNSQQMCYGVLGKGCRSFGAFPFTLWLFNIAMEAMAHRNRGFTVLKNGDFPMAM